jgi:hypothetical protein
MEMNCKLFMHLMIDTQKEDKCKTNRLGVLKMVHDLALRVMKRYRIRFFLGYGKRCFTLSSEESISHCFMVSPVLQAALGQAFERKSRE